MVQLRVDRSGTVHVHTTDEVEPLLTSLIPSAHVNGLLVVAYSLICYVEQILPFTGNGNNMETRVERGTSQGLISPIYTHCSSLVLVNSVPLHMKSKYHKCSVIVMEHLR